MRTTLRAALLSAGLALAGGPAWSYGQIDSFEASATQVLAGSNVSFNVSWRIHGSIENGGSSNLDEPAPAEGYQEWLQNWTWTNSVTARGIDLQVGDQSHHELVNVAEGAGASGSWGFSMVFDTPGLVMLSVGGSYSAVQASTSEAQLATRYCYNTGDPAYGVYLACDSWSLGYPNLQTQSEFGGSLNTPSLQIEVQAVPEPATLALWLAGIGVVAWRRRRAAPAR